MMRWPFVGRRERLRREASDWIARLNGAHGFDDRAAFGRWYRADPDHSATYERLAALFAVAGELRPAQVTEAARSPRAWRDAVPAGYVLAALAAVGAAVILSFAVLGAHGDRFPGQDGMQAAILAASGHDSRLVSLADGSEVLLSPGSELDVRIDADRRRLRLLRGEGRFTVFHETRPFIVSARGTEVVARGTQFVVSLTPGGTLVSLIEGRVEVNYAMSTAASGRNIASLEPGERLIVPARSIPPPVPVAAGPVRPAMIELDDTRLAEAVEMVNRDAGTRVRLADPALADLRVTGAFRSGDGEGFARGVAAALSLDVERASDGSFLLGAPGRPGV